MIVCKHIKAKGKPDFTPLHTHLKQVVLVSERIADFYGFDRTIAQNGAILHDIGKASPIFQERLQPDYRRTESDNTFRHEIASFFFLSLFDEKQHPQLIEMVIAHHKSVKKDSRQKGILDLEENVEDVFDLHKSKWVSWSKDALEILSAFGIATRPISTEEAERNYYNAVKYAKANIANQGYSEWKGLLMAADHFASAMQENTEQHLSKLFQTPDLNFYERTNQLYPLSLINAAFEKKHTIVVASTGAGKTDFLFRRCRNRVFYTLPFQASINAMYNRVRKELKDSNPDLDIRVLHSASTIEAKGREERMMQSLIGSSIKILTPHQISGIIFGTRSFEATILDLQGNDIVLDEIHTYTEISRAIVLKIVEVLDKLGCSIHIGTATMPTDLYNKILALLGKENVYEVSLPDTQLDMFDRHIVHKKTSWENTEDIVADALKLNQKVLIVCNRVKAAQEQYYYFKEKFPETPLILIHSRFKRGDRNAKEKQLIGLDENSNPNNEFNTSDKGCIVISTQVVEVSLDISFDLMITETAPLDSLIQRFGRINRKRKNQSQRIYKPVYVIQPPDEEKAAKPYDLKILQDSFKVLPDDDMLRERDLQQKIDSVFPEVQVMDIETHSIFKNNGTMVIDFLTHRPKSYLLELLEIDSVSCILNTDVEAYEIAGFEEQMMLEIPARFWSVKEFKQSDYGNKPFIVPASAYSNDIGFEIEKAKKKYEIF